MPIGFLYNDFAVDVRYKHHGFRRNYFSFYSFLGHLVYEKAYDKAKQYYGKMLAKMQKQKNENNQ